MKLYRLTLLFALALPLTAQTTKPATSTADARAAHALEAAKKAGAPQLYALLKNFPKGADLHMHLSGAIYAETFLAEAAHQGLCAVPVDPGVPPTPVPQGAVRIVEPEHGKCPANGSPVAAALNGNEALYDAIIDSLSMRGFVPSPGIAGYDQFFATFLRVSGMSNHQAEWLDEVTSRAAAQNEQYLEIMQTPPFSHAIAAAKKVGWPQGAETSITREQLATLRTALLASGLREDIALDRESFAKAEADRSALEHCSEATRAPACGVKVHWIYQLLRDFSPQQVFAQTLLGFEVAAADPDVVGINFVRAENWQGSMERYHLDMQMLDYLHSVYPNVHITLHAGELAPGMVSPEGLSFHIREAVELGHAERIGHGVDVLHETNSAALLKEMADKHIDVEVNLTSNDVILGVRGTDHPLHAYMAAHVPFSLSTDDEGVSRIDLTHEYVKAVEEQNLSYADLKYSARNSLEYSFLHGESLYAHPGDYTHRAMPCSAPVSANPSNACSAFLKANEKAEQQYQLELSFASFEADVK